MNLRFESGSAKLQNKSHDILKINGNRAVICLHEPNTILHYTNSDAISINSGSLVERKGKKKNKRYILQIVLIYCSEVDLCILRNICRL